MTEMVEDAFDIGTGYLNLLDVHLVFADSGSTDRLECPGTDMERDKIGGNAFLAECLEDFGREMEPCGWCSDRTLVQCIDCLVAFVVAAHSLTVQIRGQRNDTGLIDEFSETETSVPVEVHYPCISYCFATGGGKCDGLPMDVELTSERALLPFLVVTYETVPCAVPLLLERQGYWHLKGFETEDFDG